MSDQQPTVYATLFDFAANQPRRRIEARLVESARQDAEAVSALLMDAYNQGLRDGFQQGVQAATDA